MLLPSAVQKLSKSKASLYLSRILSTFTFNKVFEKGNTSTFDEVNFSPIFSTFTKVLPLLQVKLYSYNVHYKNCILFYMYFGPGDAIARISRSSMVALPTLLSCVLHVAF